ncbi:hypothetical protein L1987_30284 [Smallanthus sonchifolius]|uniref:Uncharacterized protein n=1 Tax=Smallanthus sonchifolius TaxID=185202 RepID=A0ACB9I3Q2_9ASTR|nr:hypothetical protein L1987_30284 [Smallanthus sonchifolius]
MPTLQPPETLKNSYAARHCSPPFQPPLPSFFFAAHLQSILLRPLIVPLVFSVIQLQAFVICNFLILAPSLFGMLEQDCSLFAPIV